MSSGFTELFLHDLPEPLPRDPRRQRRRAWTHALFDHLQRVAHALLWDVLPPAFFASALRFARGRIHGIPFR